MIALLASQPLLLLFVVIALGVIVGRLRLGGVRVGVAAVLFVGLAIGALDERLRLPEFVLQFGLALFVYTIGITGGAAFFRGFDRRGRRLTLLVAVALLAGAAACLAFGALLGWSPETTAGLFAGATTNTPALAAVIESSRARAAGGGSAAVIAYSVAYPGGVLGVILAIAVVVRLFRVDFASEAHGLRDYGVAGEHLASVTVRVTRAELASAPIVRWREREGWHVILGRVQRGGDIDLVDDDTVVGPGDEVTLIGADEDLAEVTRRIGEPSDHHLELDRSKLDFRRLFVSDHDVVGRSLRDLALTARFGAIVTRVRRGDADLLPTAETRLELGDRVRVVARRDRIDEVTRFFGDSYGRLSEIDASTFALGLAAGIALGLVPIPLPGEATLRLGFAGGPLLVALVLSALGRTGPFVWIQPYSPVLTLRQLGLLLFLAGVGTRSGYAFASSLAAGEGVDLVLAGAGVTFVLAAAALVLGHRLLRVPMTLMIGVVAGQHTQPAALGYAVERAGNDVPHVGYTGVFATATVLKIVLAQLVLLLAR